MQQKTKNEPVFAPSSVVHDTAVQSKQPGLWTLESADRDGRLSTAAGVRTYLFVMSNGKTYNVENKGPWAHGSWSIVVPMCPIFDIIFYRLRPFVASIWYMYV